MTAAAKRAPAAAAAPVAAPPAHPAPGPGGAATPGTPVRPAASHVEARDASPAAAVPFARRDGGADAGKSRPPAEKNPRPAAGGPGGGPREDGA